MLARQWKSGTLPEVSEHAIDCNHGPRSDWVFNIEQSWQHFSDSESHPSVMELWEEIFFSKCVILIFCTYEL